MAKKIDYASLFTLRSDGRYQGYWHDLVDGEPVGPRHTICDRDPERLYHRIAEKEIPTVLTFRLIAERWRNARSETLRPGTWACYEAPYRRALELFGDTPAAEILTPDIKAHLERLKEQGLGAKSIKTQRTVYSQIFKYAINDEALGRQLRFNPADGAALPSGMKRPAKRAAPDDEIIRQIRQRASSAYWGLYCLLLISTGFRRGEALALQWRDIDLTQKTVSCTKALSWREGYAVIGPPKTENGVRAVPLLPDLLPALKAYKPKNAKPEHYVFSGEDPSRPMSESTFRRRWMHYCKDMDFVTDTPEEKVSKQGKRYTVHHYKATLTPHVLRHGYATMLYDAGVDVYAAQKYLGHADVQTTMAIYTHLSRSREAGSLKKLEAYVKKSL